VTFDATPSSQDQLGTGGNGFRARLHRLIDVLRFQWTKWVVDYDLSRQLGFFKDIGKAFDRAGKWLKARAGDAKNWVKRHWLIAGLIALAIVALLLARARRGRIRGADTPKTARKARNPIAAIYTRVLGKLERCGLRRGLAVTPRELARGAAERGLPYAKSLGELTELYYAAQWGGEDVLVARARALAEEIEVAAAVSR
jgi:hypothetical protein